MLQQEVMDAKNITRVFVTNLGTMDVLGIKTMISIYFEF